MFEAMFDVIKPACLDMVFVTGCRGAASGGRHERRSPLDAIKWLTDGPARTVTECQCHAPSSATSVVSAANPR